MRPIRRGASPQAEDFDPYATAQPYLVSRLGMYCSYCERRICTNLAVEHIQPKVLAEFAHLEGTWTNYLLACVNCNSTKSAKPVNLHDTLLPDRDNTFVAFSYLKDGSVVPSAAVDERGMRAMAEATLALTGLDRANRGILDENDKEVALDRASQRREAWLVALANRDEIEAGPHLIPLRDAAVRVALATGFFSIWMTVFADDFDMRQRLIVAFSGTQASQCFDAITAQPVSPAPNPDRLVGGGKL